MIKKERKTKIKIEGVSNAFLVEDVYEDEPISNDICSSINDFYNLMHLIKKSWVNEKYSLIMEGAGYTLYDENNKKAAWIGIKEKYTSLMFIIIYGGVLYSNVMKNFKDPMVVLDFDEDLWLYSELKITDILKGASFKKQNKIVKDWINDTISKIL